MTTLLDDARRALEKLTDLRTSFTASSRGVYDGILRLVSKTRRVDFQVEIKRSLTRSAAALLVSRGVPSTRNLVVITSYVNPSVAQVLREGSVGYLDSVGNCFLRDEDFYCFIQGQRRPTTKQPVSAFTDAGLKTIYVFLLNSENVGRPYRDIAKSAGVSRGSVGNTIKDLLKLEFVASAEDQGRQLVNREALIERWVTSYADNLRPKLVRGRFRFVDPSAVTRWADLTLDPREAQWGGEPAAAILTDYLRPQDFTLYTNLTTAQLVRRHGIAPDENGRIEVLEMFWIEEKKESPIVPPLLVYADLVASGNARNLEVAALIYESKIEYP